MLYRTIKRMIERGDTDGLKEKLDIFLLGDRITAEEYKELNDMLDHA